MTLPVIDVAYDHAVETVLRLRRTVHDLAEQYSGDVVANPDSTEVLRALVQACHDYRDACVRLAEWV